VKTSNRALIQGIIVATCLEVLRKTIKNLRKNSCPLPRFEPGTRHMQMLPRNCYICSAYAGTDTTEKRSPIHPYLISSGFL
jgi:hypothetical protein